MSLFELDAIFIKENAIASFDELQLALNEAIAISKQENIELKISNEELLNFNFDNLGNPLSLQAKQYHYVMLVKQFAKKYEYIYQQALNFHIQSISAANNFLAICKSRGLIKPCELLDTYIEKCSWAELMLGYIQNDVELTERLDNEFPTEDDFDHLFTLALGCYLFNQVNEKLNQGYPVDLNILGQGFAAIEYSHSWWSWNVCDAEFSKKMANNVFKRLENDPKQLALKSIEKDFRESSYPFKVRGYKTKFTKEMWNKYPEIENIKTIERLVSKLCKTHSAS